MEGRTRCNKIVVFPGDPRHRGQVMDVRIERVGTFTLYGDPAVVNLGPEEDSERGNAEAEVNSPSAQHS